MGRYQHGSRLSLAEPKKMLVSVSLHTNSRTCILTHMSQSDRALTHLEDKLCCAYHVQEQHFDTKLHRCESTMLIVKRLRYLF